MTLFDRIKQRGESKGYSIAKIEELAGMSPNSLYKWKKQTPKIDKVNAIADILDVSTDYLLGRTNTESIEGERLSEQEEKLLMRFRRGSKNLTEDEKAIYERQAMNLFDYINQTMHDLDEKNKPK